MTKIEVMLKQFEDALVQFEEVLKQEKNEFIRDSAIKRFEIVFDLAWKTLKTFLEKYNNAICSSPRSCFKEAFRQKLLEYNDFWIGITSTRNYTAHTYNEKMAERVYAQLPESLNHFKNLLTAIKKEME